MLLIDPVQRSSFAELRDTIPQIFNQTESRSGSLRLSVVKNVHSKMIMNDNSVLRSSRVSSVSSLGSVMSDSRSFASKLNK